MKGSVLTVALLVLGLAGCGRRQPKESKPSRLIQLPAPQPGPEKEARKWYETAGMLLINGKYPDALVAIEECARLAPDYAQGWERQAEILLRLGRHEAALVALKQAVLADPKFEEAHRRRGLILERLGRTVSAQEAYRTALKILSARMKGSAATPELLNRRAGLYFLCRRQADALEDIAESLQLDSDNVYTRQLRQTVLARDRQAFLAPIPEPLR